MIRKYLTPEEVKLLLEFLRKQSKEPDDCFSTKQSTYIKLHAFIALMTMTGMRTIEARMLKVGDVNLGKKPCIFIRTSKNGKSRQVPIPNRLKTLLKTYMKWRRIDDPKLGKDDYVFTTKRSKQPYSHVALHNLFKIVCIRSGIGDEHSLHGLRHSYGFRVYGQTKDLRLTQELLGHKSISSTTIYTQLDPDSMRQAINSIF